MVSVIRLAAVWGQYKHEAGVARSRLTNRGDNIGKNAVLDTLLSECLCEANHSKLGSGIVGLAEIAKEASSRGSVDDATVLLLAEMRPSGASALV
jgi:hypothetical protein